MDDAEKFQAVRTHFEELATYFPEGVVAIGGFAVWLHSAKLPEDEREGTRDGDAMLTRPDFEELKTLHAIESNPRLGKHQFKADGVEFDLYVEYEDNELRVPVGDVIANSVVLDGIRTASLEHLLVLKLDAALSRQGSEHGDKDDRDIAKIVTLCVDPNPALMEPYIDEGRAAKLRKIGKDHEVFRDICKGNSKRASRMQHAFEENFDSIVQRLKEWRLELGRDGRAEGRGLGG